MKYTIRKKTPASQTPAVQKYEKVLKFAKKDKDPLTYLLAKLYESAPIRTDYEDIKIVKNLKDTNTTDNFIILPAKGNAKVLVQTHKTEGKFGNINVEYPADVTELIRKYVKAEKIEVGKDPLFGKLKTTIDKLSTFICEEEKNAGANLIRRSIASSLYDKFVKGQATEAEILQQSNLMAHSYSTHIASYVYKIA